jgi:CheY-like chemotaxis protein
VLFVDDDADSRFLYKHHLESVGGYRVVEVEDGREVLDLAARLSPHVIVLDVTLPGIDGIQVARALRKDERTCAIPIVALTGRAEMKGAPESAPFTAVLVKPCSADALLTQVGALLAP